MKNLVGVAAAIGLLFVCMSPAAAVTIDDFSDKAANYDTSSNNPESLYQTPVSGTISGDRFTVIENEAGSSLIQLEINTTSQSALLSAGSGADGIWRFIYNPFPSTDLTSGGNDNAFGVEFLNADFGGTLTVYVDDALTTTGFATVPVPAGPSTVYVPYNLLSNGVDVTQAVGIQIDVDGIVNGDYEVDFLETTFVPEPSSFALAGLGMAGLLLAGWRKRRR